MRKRLITFSSTNNDVYHLSIKYVRFSFRTLENLNSKHKHAKDQLIRASQSIPLNIAEGNGKATSGDRRRYLEKASSFCEFLLSLSHFFI